MNKFNENSLHGVFMTESNDNIERLSIEAFCKKNRIKKGEIAEHLGVFRQQISGWINPVKGKGFDKQPDDGDIKRIGRYLIEHNHDTGEVRIVLAQQMVHCFNINELKNGD